MGETKAHINPKPSNANDAPNCIQRSIRPLSLPFLRTFVLVYLCIALRISSKTRQTQSQNDPFFPWKKEIFRLSARYPRYKRSFLLGLSKKKIRFIGGELPLRIVSMLIPLSPSCSDGSTLQFEHFSGPGNLTAILLASRPRVLIDEIHSTSRKNFEVQLHKN